MFLLLVSCHDKSFLNNTVPSVLELLQDLLAPIVEADGILEGRLVLIYCRHHFFSMAS